LGELQLITRKDVEEQVNARGVASNVVVGAPNTLVLAHDIGVLGGCIMQVFEFESLPTNVMPGIGDGCIRAVAVVQQKQIEIGRPGPGNPTAMNGTIADGADDEIGPWSVVRSPLLVEMTHVNSISSNRCFEVFVGHYRAAMPPPKQRTTDY
jgi:hypothetical protein